MVFSVFKTEEVFDKKKRRIAIKKLSSVSNKKYCGNSYEVIDWYCTGIYFEKNITSDNFISMIKTIIKYEPLYDE